MDRQKMIGWTAVFVSLLVPYLWFLWPTPQSRSEFLFMAGADCTMWLLALLASIIAATTVSRRWFYVTAFWGMGAALLVIGFVMNAL